MFYYFYTTRHITGLILVLSPMAGLLYINFSLTLSITFLCSLITGLILCPFCAEHFSFRLCTVLASVLACAGSFFCAGGAEKAAACLTGLAAAWLALYLPPCLMSAGRALQPAALWTVSLALGTVYGNLMERNTYLFLVLSLLSSVSGSLFFLTEPPLTAGMSSESVSADRRAASIKIMFFAAILGFAAALSYFAMAFDLPFDFFLAPKTMFFTGLITGAAAAGLISDSKSVYSGCIFAVFIAEIAAAGFAHGTRAVILLYIGSLASGMLFSVIIIMLPLLTSFVSDSYRFRHRLCLCFTAAACGALSAVLLFPYCENHPLLNSYLSPSLFLLLVISFFVLFSAWKHRLFLLKSTGI